MSDLFISYSRDDRTFVERLYAAVEASERKAWLDKYGIEKGEKFWQEIEEGIDGANAFVFVISPTSIKKAAGAEEYCRREIEYAVRQGKRIIPIVWRDRFQPDERVEDRLDETIQAHQELKERNWLEICDRDFESCFSELIDTAEKDLEYVKRHTELLEDARAWIREGRKDSDLIRGESLSKAEDWLELGEKKIQIQKNFPERKHFDPEPTEEHRNFINQSRQAEDARLRREALMKRSIRWGSGILVVSLIGAGISAWGAWKASELRREAEIGIRLEQEGVEALEQFKTQQTEGLLSAMRSVKELKTLVKDGRPLEKYPAVSPLLALQMNLDRLEEKQLSGHQGYVTDMKFSPNGKIIATAGKDGSARVWDLEGKELIQMRGHQGSVNSVQFSPNGELIATTGEDHTIRIWNLEGKELIKISNSKDFVRSVNFSPDGKFISIVDDDNTIKLWNLEGKEIFQVKYYKSLPSFKRFCIDGTKIAASGQGSMLKIWDLSGKEIISLDKRDNNYSHFDVHISPDCKTIAIPDKDNKNIQLLNLNGKILATLKGGLNRRFLSPFSQDGTQIITLEESGLVRLWDIAGKELFSLVGHQGAIYSAVFIGNNIATHGADGTLRIWNSNGKELTRHHGLFDEVGDIEINSQRLVIATRRFQGVRLLNFENKEDEKEIRGFIQFSSDSKKIITLGRHSDFEDNDKLRFWSLEGQKILELQTQGTIYEVKVSPDEKLIAARDSNGFVLGNLTNNTEQKFTGKSGSHPSNFYFSPDSKKVILVWDDEIELLDVQNRKLISLERNLRIWSNSVKFSPDGKFIIIVDKSNVVRIKNLAGEEISQINEYQKEDKTIGNIQLSPDSKTIAVTTGLDSMKLWDLNGKKVIQMKGDKDSNHVAFSPDGANIITVGWDGTIRLWNRSGEEISQMRTVPESVSSVGFSPNGKIISTVQKNGSIKFWTRNWKQIAQYKGKDVFRVDAEASISPDWKHVAVFPLNSSADQSTLILRTLDFDIHSLLNRACLRLKTYLLQSPELKDDRKMCGLE